MIMAERQRTTDWRILNTKELNVWSAIVTGMSWSNSSSDDDDDVDEVQGAQEV